MSPVKTLARIVSARKRLRDLSAGEMAVADAHRQDAQHHAARLHDEHQRLLDDAAAHLVRANSIRALELFQDQRHAADNATRAARAVLDRHHALVEKARQNVNRRERDLRGSERQLDGARRERDAGREKAEQTDADERSATAMHRKETP
jgi:hypothetical protein